MHEDRTLYRRNVLQIAAAFGAMSIFSPLRQALAQARQRTPEQILGPFYPVKKKPDPGGDLTHLPHGRLIGLMLPHVLEWSAIGCPEQLAMVARALGEDVDGLSLSAAADRALVAVRRLCKEMEIDEPLRSHGVTEDTLRVCAERVYAQHTPRSEAGPRGFRSVDETLAVLKQAY